MQFFLLSLYYNNLLKNCRLLDPIVDLINALERQPILQAFIIGERRRFSTSTSLSPKAIEEAVQYQLEFLYAFDDEAWHRS